MTEPERFGRYRVVGSLGSGAMGAVYAAVDDVLGREVAVKTLRDVAVGLAAQLLDERFRQEARAIAALAHPAIVQVFDIDLDADPPYLVMERVAGPSLKERFAAGPMPPGEVRMLGIQIARALAAAHASGVLHRDVKPANILIAGADAWKLADFGVAHVPDSSLTMSGQFIGTPAYAPAEALVRGISGPAGDVFGLGATLYQAAAGRWPRLDGTTGALLAPVPPLRELAPEVPADLASAIDQAVALEPGDRPTATELAQLLAGGTAVPVAASPSVASLAVPGRWRSWAILGGVLALGAIIAGVASHSAGGRGAVPTALPFASDSPVVAPSPAPGPATAPPPAAPPLRPSDLVVTSPVGMDDKQSRDWSKIFDEVDKGHYEGARHKLDEFVDKNGETDETRALAPQLDALGPDVHPPGPPGHGKHKGHKKDDD